MLAPLVLALALAADPSAEFARALEERIAAGTDALTPALDAEALLNRALEGIGGDEEFRAGYKKGAAGGMRALGEQLVANVKAGGGFKFLRLHAEGTKTFALFRSLQVSGVNYLDLELSAPKGGPVRVVDIYVYDAGERLSDTQHHLLLVAVAERNQGLLDKLAGKEQVLLKNLPALTAMNTATREQRWDDVLRTFGTLPEPLRKEKLFLRLRLAAAMNVGGDTYVRAIEDLQKAWPNDPSSDMAAIDGALLKKKYGESLKAIDRLAARVGGDAYLLVMRAGVYVTWGKRPEARKALELAISQEPDLLEPYWSLITFALEDKRFDDVARLLAGVEKTGKVALADLGTVPQYAEFAASEAGKRWRTEHLVKAEAQKP